MKVVKVGLYIDKELFDYFVSINKGRRALAIEKLEDVIEETLQELKQQSEPQQK